MSSMKKKYSNNPDVFCYICGSFTPTAQRQSINNFVEKAHFTDFKIKRRDQDKAWVPHKVCTSCVKALRSWSHEKDKHLPFGIPIIWRKQIDHVADWYFCMVNVKGINKQNKHYTALQYSIINSALKGLFLTLWRTQACIQLRSLSWRWYTQDILQLQQMMTCLSIVLARVVDYCLHLDPAEINDWIHDLNLPKQSSELLASRWQENHLVHPGTNITSYRNREQEFFQIFTSSDGLMQVELSWFYLAIINIQLEKKHKSMQGRQGIERTGRLSSRCPSAVARLPNPRPAGRMRLPRLY